MFCEPHRVTFSIGEDFFAYQIDGIGKETNEQKEHVTDSLPTKRTWALEFFKIHATCQVGYSLCGSRENTRGKEMKTRKNKVKLYFWSPTLALISHSHFNSQIWSSCSIKSCNVGFRRPSIGRWQLSNDIDCHVSTSEKHLELRSSVVKKIYPEKTLQPFLIYKSLTPEASESLSHRLRHSTSTIIRWFIRCHYCFRLHNVVVSMCYLCPSCRNCWQGIHM